MKIIPSRLLIGIVLGIATGLIYGWIISPVEYVNTAPNSLRADYRTDYVLMVAQAYSAEADLGNAQKRLAALGPEAPGDMVVQAIQYAVEHNFSQADIEVLRQLALALRSLPPPAAIGVP
jgi:hypothetical protein